MNRPIASSNKQGREAHGFCDSRPLRPHGLWQAAMRWPGGEARMKLKVLLPFLAIAVLLGACNPGGPSMPACPAGAKAMGSPPPNGDETWCQKIVDGQPVKDGPFALYRPSGSKMLEGYYVDGKQNGDWTMWYDNGQKASIDHYKDGIQDGQHIGWYTNGKISAKGMYKDGKREGVWKRWDSQGFKNWDEVYKDDKRIS